MATADIACVLDARASPGEGPVWCPIERALYRVDVHGPAVHRLESATGAVAVWPMPEDVYVTSARGGLTEDDLRRGPLAGGLLALAPAVRALPEPRFAG